jgi:hypothetical protein
LGYDSGERDINKARCQMKVCCIKRLGTAHTCADCPDCLSCETLRAFHGKNAYKYRKYSQSLEFIRSHGYERFLEAAAEWKGAYGKLPKAGCADTRKGTPVNTSKLNREWHLGHRMPKNPTLQQRLEWHVEHAKNCPCRAITGKIAEEMKKRGMPIPRYPA